MITACTRNLEEEIAAKWTLKTVRSLSHLYSTYCKLFCSSCVNCWTGKCNVMHGKCTVAYIFCPHPLGADTGHLWQCSSRDVMVPDPGEPRGRWQHPAHIVVPHWAHISLRRREVRAGLAELQLMAQGRLKLRPVLCGKQGCPSATVPWGWGPWSWAPWRKEGLNLQTKQLLTAASFVWIKGAFLLLGHTHVKLSQRQWERQEQEQ